ncbi:MAG: DUF389 domain-containing protein [Prevotella sp.]|nr:DUF389 domain-containing protein [Prevotella sp.]
MFDIKNITEELQGYFNLQADRDEEEAIVSQVSNGVSFHGAKLWVLIFAILIASLGLNINSTAVIIGAMLISPLMGPIIGMGLAVGTNDLDLLKRAVKNYTVATVISVLSSTVYFLVSPLGEAQSELLARTSPTLYDVLIAFCGGAAGIIALCTRDKGQVIPGVAIATALMPPLCTAGYGLATGHLLYFLGAFYLFFINTVFIALSTFFGVRLLGFRRHSFGSAWRERRANRIVTLIVLLTMLPAAVMTVAIVKRSFFDHNVRRFIKNELTQSGTQVISNSVEDRTLRIVAVGREIDAATQKLAQSRMESYGLREYHLNVIQGAQTDSLLQLNEAITQMSTTREADRQQLMELSSQTALLSEQLEGYVRYEEIATALRPELKVLFPQVRSLSLSPVSEVQRDTTAARHFVVALVGMDGGRRLPAADAAKLRQWLQSRVGGDSLVVIER